MPREPLFQSNISIWKYSAQEIELLRTAHRCFVKYLPQKVRLENIEQLRDKVWLPICTGSGSTVSHIYVLFQQLKTLQDTRLEVTKSQLGNIADIVAELQFKHGVVSENVQKVKTAASLEKKLIMASFSIFYPGTFKAN
jgi:hypothetical protein